MTRASDESFAAQRRRMVEHDLAGRGIRDQAVLTAMGTVPRERFVPADQQHAAYDDCALPIGYGQTISQPYMVAFMVEKLHIQPDNVVLEVGAGSGYQAAVMSRMCRHVYAVEIVEPLAESARRTLAALGYDNVTIVCGDGTLGYPPSAPYDRIIVAAAAPTIPQPLIDQLAEGGRMVIPVGDRSIQRCQVCTKRDGKLQVSDSIGCVFVPLVGEHGWR